ncbi:MULTISPECIES: NAD(P)/FAD-dependent oxidoreductase [unclassified Lentimicrobium]|uniref:phytoene desaturase family protein n=1 Tax=unclassified Lentimicrobium TaxID=2677434 RepID=UPI0015532D66|nr:MULTISPECIES: NAD(P)/FAD-dependent oxidoreductase [unclassified Lentimicrobium]NPD44677.1 NAD(P)/FAD-dependent oxidoreductase [Lentimicrobium sp. S6]NPD86490.1 NAD(P)/FAD-dependent oxidoreductase [Lentimicrobium sp. L6]
MSKNNSCLKDSYDVVIIGGGISGLTSSALLSRVGLSCCVIEMDARPGGYLAGFDRGAFRFDSSIHWLNNCAAEGWVGRIFDIIGDDYPKAKIQKNIRRFISKDFDYLVTNYPDNLKNQWIKEFPEDKKGITRFFRDAKRISKSFDDYINLSRTMDTMGVFEKGIYGLKMLKFAIPFIPHLKYSGEEGISKGLSKYFSNPKLQSVFCTEPDLLSCLIPISWAYSNNFQTPPTGGSQSFPEWLVHSSKEMGAEICLKSKVIEILTQKNNVKGVKVQFKSETREINAKYVVAACDASSLYSKLLPSTEENQKKSKQIEDSEMYASALSVSIGLDCKAEDLGFGEENIYLADSSLNRAELDSGDPKTSGMHIIASSVRDKSLAPLSKGTLTLFIPAWIEQNNYWACVRDEHGQFKRTKAYRDLKAEYANILIDRVRDSIAPNIRDHIEYLDVATPITLLRYTGNRNGSMMGQKPGKKNMQANVASYKTPYKNLYQSGHWADLGGGILIAMKSSVNTTLMILKKEKPMHFKLLAKYIDGKIPLSQLKSFQDWKLYDNSWVQELTPAQKLGTEK